MKTPQGRNRIGLLLTACAVIAAIVVYVVAFHGPAPGDDKEAVASRVDGPQPMTETMPSDAEPAGPAERAVQPPKVADPGREPPEERQYASEHPLYFRAVFGQDGTNSMLGALDESAGTGTGHNVAYVDENMNGTLADDDAKELARLRFNGPLKDEANANYTLDIYPLARETRTGPGDYYFVWFLHTAEWNYFFINGKIKLFSSAADALRGPPVRLGGQCKWEISSVRKGGRAVVSAALKDSNGCTLRWVMLSGRRLSPRLTLVRDGKVETEKYLEFG